MVWKSPERTTIEPIPVSPLISELVKQLGEIIEIHKGLLARLSHPPLLIRDIDNEMEGKS